MMPVIRPHGRWLYGGKTVQNKTHITELNIINPIEPLNIVDLLTQIDLMPNLRCFSLANVPIPIVGLSHLLKNLEGKLSTLRLINIGGNDDHSTIIAEFLKRNPNLEELCLSYNNFGNTELAEIFKSSSISGSLKIIDLSCNRLTDQKIIPLVENLGIYSQLYSISFAGNPIQNQGVIDFVTHILEIKTLALLNFSECRITDIGGIVLLNFIQNSIQMLTVNLSGNQLSTEFASCLCSFIRFRKPFVLLDLSRNNFDIQLMEEICSAIGNTLLSYNDIRRIESRPLLILKDNETGIVIKEKFIELSVYSFYEIEI